MEEDGPESEETPGAWSVDDGDETDLDATIAALRCRGLIDEEDEDGEESRRADMLAMTPGDFTRFIGARCTVVRLR